MKPLVRILITRSPEDAAALVRAVRALGCEAVVEPMLTVRVPAGGFLDLEGVQALAFTSSNGVRAFCARSARRDLPAYAVGESTAATARAAGFAAVESADGNVAALVQLIGRSLDPLRGAVLHAAASIVAGDLAGALMDAGFVCRREVLYEATPASAISPQTAQAVREGAIAIAVFFSPRAAATFARLAGDQGLAPCLSKMTAVCLSDAVGHAVEHLGWARISVAERPTAASLTALVRQAVAAIG